MVKALIVTGFGINCEVEMAAAYRLAGAEATICHLNEVLSGKISLHSFDILNFPGGFSFGDDLSSGKVMANKIKYKQMSNGKVFFDEIKQFLADGKYILGICNGFQILVRMGLLPNLEGDFEQSVSLVENESGKFEDRWVHCKVNNSNNSPFLKGLDNIPLPVRHREGHLLINDEVVLKQIVDNNLHALAYSDAAGNITAEYPANPNGSTMSIAGLTSISGQVFGLMPHPEAYLSFYNHPNWGALKRTEGTSTEEGWGLKIFKNIVNHIQGA